MTKCPYCARKLLEEELYCYFCEQDVSKLKTKKPKQTKTRKEPKVQAYCVKCKKKVNIKNPKYYTMKNKRVSIKGICPNCSTKVFRILGMKSRK